MFTKLPLIVTLLYCVLRIILYCIYFKKLCDTLTDYVPIYTDGSKEGDKVAFAIVTPSQVMLGSWGMSWQILQQRLL